MFVNLGSVSAVVKDGCSACCVQLLNKVFNSR